MKEDEVFQYHFDNAERIGYLIASFIKGTHELLTGICIELGEFGELIKIKKPENQRFASLALL